MNIKDLPEYIDVNLKDEGISYPDNGEMVEAYAVRLYCFGYKHYLQTWPLRQRVIKANVKLITLFKDIQKDDNDEPGETTAEQFGQMMLMGGFDLASALEEFKQLAVAHKLIELDDNVHLSKERWLHCSDVVKEQLIFEYLAAFIQPCVM